MYLTASENRYEILRDTEDRVVVGHHEQTATIKDHFHYCLEFIYILDGELQATVSGQDLTVKSGHVLLISCCELHHLAYSPNARYYVLLLPHKFFSSCSAILARNSFEPRCVSDDSGTILTIFQLFQNVDKMNPPFDRLNKGQFDNIYKSLSTVLLETLLSITTLTERSENFHQSVRVIEYLYSHFKEPITMQTLAKVFLCTQNELSHDFRQTFKISPHDFLNQLRTEEVCNCIQADSRMTLEEIAEESGFQSVQTLLRVFKKLYGCTPKEFKRQHDSRFCRTE